MIEEAAEEVCEGEGALLDERVAEAGDDDGLERALGGHRPGERGELRVLRPGDGPRRNADLPQMLPVARLRARAHPGERAPEAGRVVPRPIADQPRPSSPDGDPWLELLPHLLEAMAREARITLHLRVDGARSVHHHCEVMMKAFAVALRQAAESDPRLEGIGRAGVMPSTKESMD